MRCNMTQYVRLPGCLTVDLAQRGLLQLGEDCACKYTRQGARHDGRADGGPRVVTVRRRDWLHLRLRAAVAGAAMLFDYSLAGLVSLGLLTYLTYALLRPERF